jgi:hypothetical protein
MKSQFMRKARKKRKRKHRMEGHPVFGKMIQELFSGHDFGGFEGFTPASEETRLAGGGKKRRTFETGDAAAEVRTLVA